MRVALTSDGGRGDRGTGDSGTVVSPIGALMLFFVSWGCGTARWWAFGWYDGDGGDGGGGDGDGFTASVSGRYLGRCLSWGQ